VRGQLSLVESLSRSKLAMSRGAPRIKGTMMNSLIENYYPTFELYQSLRA
jgi:hypothetical protein